MRSPDKLSERERKPEPEPERELEPEPEPEPEPRTEEACERLIPALRAAAGGLRAAGSPEEKRDWLDEIYRLVEEAWLLPGLGREVASSLCDQIRLEGVLDQLLELLRCQNLSIQHRAAKLLEQTLIAENRDRLARTGLGEILELAKDRDNAQLAIVVTGILRHMFKHTEETSYLLITNGGLDSILYWCRSRDSTILQHCSIALANCAMYGGNANQRLMIEKKTADWLFPLAFSKDQLVRFHACLAITVLATNKEIEKEVEKSGTLDLVEPFIASLHLEEFAHNWQHSTDNSQGRTACDLQRLVQLLDSSRIEAQCMAAFYLCVEAGIKLKQKKTQIFHEIGATQSLKRLVSYSGNSTISTLAKKALHLMGEKIPRRLSPTVPNWKPGEVQTWLQQIGFMDCCKRFLELQVDGDLLLMITDSELREDLGILSSVTRRRFVRELTELKTYANYSTCDPSNLADWLGSIDPCFRQYTYNLVHCGIGKRTLPEVTDQQLQLDCQIEIGFHRSRILAAGRELLPSSFALDSLQPPSDSPDVFISYRRATGSQLASLLKVHLQLRGFSVFIDVEKLEAGKFDDKLCQSVKKAKNFVLVLSANALDRCIGDTEMKDWVHREIVMAMNSKKNIVPVVDNFTWPELNSLPEDMRGILKFNNIKWSHEYQDASIEKILRFLQTSSQNVWTVPADTGKKAVMPHHE
ncbi:NAD(+) hydrolase SARM1 isoform X2 [Carcharodon carcharias]|uniref:NAD(+) hydrolase SARM1 isoform X2 n=1 Tax=Carcharodon carcharias TaxID=13397 RepID=UPI001B7E4C67|nr:NAD(+) hydrolase SARM1 isoform X2 [Carcharodon carcharias]